MADRVDAVDVHLVRLLHDVPQTHSSPRSLTDKPAPEPSRQHAAGDERRRSSAREEAGEEEAPEDRARGGQRAACDSRTSRRGGRSASTPPNVPCRKPSMRNGPRMMRSVAPTRRMISISSRYSIIVRRMTLAIVNAAATARIPPATRPAMLIDVDDAPQARDPLPVVLHLIDAGHRLAARRCSAGTPATARAAARHPLRTRAETDSRRAARRRRRDSQNHVRKRASASSRVTNRRCASSGFARQPSLDRLDLLRRGLAVEIDDHPRLPLPLLRRPPQVLRHQEERRRR